MRRMSAGICVVALASIGAVVAGPSVASAAGGAAPGGPGHAAVFDPSDKHGFGTAHSTASHVWFTLEAGRLSDIYYPDLGTPAVQELQFIVSDGKTFAEREQDGTAVTSLTDAKSLTYRQVVTSATHKWRLTKTIVTDPARASVLTQVTFESLTGKPYQLFVYYDPSLSNNGMDDAGSVSGDALIASDASAASALVARPAFTAKSNGYLGVNDGWTDISAHHTMTHTYSSATKGNLVQTARLPLTGLRGSRSAVVTLGFGAKASTAEQVARASLHNGFDATAKSYAAGWHTYVDSLKKPPAGLSSLERSTYLASVMVLAASEDKVNRGAFVASPTMPWIWGSTKIEKPSGAYHLVWSRDLYEIATALIADGDTAAANRALTFLFTKQQEADGHFPQNSLVTGAEHWKSIQLDETADPIVLAWQLGHRDAATWSHVKKAADYLVSYVDAKTGLAAPFSEQERWENQSGYSPATIAAEIAGLVCAADIARANGDTASADRYLAKADAWQLQVKSLTMTTNGPLSTKPYFLRLTKDGNPNMGTTYSVGDSGATYDQRAVVDPSFLELVRLGVLRADDPDVINSLAVVDQQLGVVTPNGQFWHRYNGDGYGEQKNGAPWDFGVPDGSQTTIGRAWPIFAGERGEYELAAGTSAAARLTAMAKSGNDGRMLPEQVWDQNPPSGTTAFPAGEGTFSATPLVWTHAQFVRLAQSIAAGRPVETPYIVACRYVGCPG